MAESKKEKFTRLAEARMNATLKNIELLGNLSNTSNYEYDDEDIAKMLKTLRSAINDLEESYVKTERKKRFSL